MANTLKMKLSISLMFAASCFYGQALLAQPLAKRISVQAPILNVRAEQSVKGAILVKLKQLDEADVIEQGKSDVIDGVTDFWYRIKTDGGVEGYVFGHLTSLKIAGRNKVIATFDGCEMGDGFHLYFGEGDYGSGRNNYGPYELCINGQNGEEPNPKYVGKEFELITNNLLARIYCEGGSGGGEICVQEVSTIVSLTLIR